jgi:aerobactin synthase
MTSREESINSALKYWPEANRRLVAKALSELGYEGLFDPQVKDLEDRRVACVLALASGVRYEYEGFRNVWGETVVDPDSIRREPASKDGVDVERFVLDARAELDANSSMTMGLLEELNRTLLADCRLEEARANLTAADAVELPSVDLQARLAGHPKMLTSKGRLGWSTDDFLQYSPEADKPFRLFWMAVARSATLIRHLPGVGETDLQAESLAPDDRGVLEERCKARGVSSERHALMPVHPWQWNSTIIPRFAGEIASGRIVALGQLGDRYRSLLSIRTLANADRRSAADVKISLSMFNGLVYRGVREDWILCGSALSLWLERIVARDADLHGRGVVLLKDLGGMSYAHPVCRELSDVPYRYGEQLGVLWRESVESKLRGGERAMLLATFMERDASGRSWVSECIRRSGLSVESWLERLFEVATIPFYHLLCRYRFCPEAHGQNVVVILRDWTPVGLALKDVHGDLDEGDFEEHRELSPDIVRLVPQLPTQDLLHNVMTTHFVTTLRFISNTMWVADGIRENVFYGALAKTLRRYMESHPELGERFATFDLFAPEMARYCLNRVRFRLGYGSTDLRRPGGRIYGKPLENPLHRVDRALSPEAP